MTAIISILTVLTWVLACWFMLVRIESGHTGKDVHIKTVVAACILAIGVLSDVQWLMLRDGELLRGEQILHVLGMLGLILYALGDIRLGQAHIDKSKKISYRRQGIILFALGHLMFIAVILSLYDMTYKKYIFAAAAVAVVVALLTALFARRMNIHFGRYTALISVYIGILVFTAVLAWALWHSMGEAYDTALAAYQETIASPEYQEAIAADPAAVIAAPVMNPALGSADAIRAAFLAFVISDASLAPMYFGKVGGKPHYVIFNHVSYYMAQLLLAYSLIIF